VFIDKSGPPEAEPRAVAQGFIPPVLDPILGDYKRNIAGARDPEVLTLFATVVEKLKTNVLNDVPRILEAVFECTLTMITANFEDYPEHRICFFEFLKVRLINTFVCFNFILGTHSIHFVSPIGHKSTLLSCPLQHSSRAPKTGCRRRCLGYEAY